MAVFYTDRNYFTEKDKKKIKECFAERTIIFKKDEKYRYIGSTTSLELELIYANDEPAYDFTCPFPLTKEMCKIPRLPFLTLVNFEFYDKTMTSLSFKEIAEGTPNLYNKEFIKFLEPLNKELILNFKIKKDFNI